MVAKLTIEMQNFMIGLGVDRFKDEPRNSRMANA
jgi:hypothetical protein